MDRIAAIIGAGLIGRAWAVVFARAGWTVRLFDAVPAQLSAARRQIEQALTEQQQAGLAADVPAALERIAPCIRVGRCFYAARDFLSRSSLDYKPTTLPEVVSVAARSMCSNPS